MPCTPQTGHTWDDLTIFHDPKPFGCLYTFIRSMDATVSNSKSSCVCLIIYLRVFTIWLVWINELINKEKLCQSWTNDDDWWFES